MLSLIMMYNDFRKDLFFTDKDKRKVIICRMIQMFCVLGTDYMKCSLYSKEGKN